MCEALFFEDPQYPHSTFPNHVDMFREPHLSYTESDMTLNASSMCCAFLSRRRLISW